MPVDFFYLLCLINKIRLFQMQLDPDPNRRMLRAVFVCLVLPVIAIGVKRTRERAQELIAAVKVRSSIDRKKRKPNVKRNREGLEQELRDLDEATFTRMFRMNQNTFFQLHTMCASKIKIETPKSQHMAILSSGPGGPVTTLILLAGTHLLYFCRYVSIYLFMINVHSQQQFAGWQADPFGTLVSCSKCHTRLFTLTSTK